MIRWMDGSTMEPQELISATKQGTKSAFWTFMFAFLAERTVKIRQVSLKLIEKANCVVGHTVFTQQQTALPGLMVI